jgi:hypothetical protein
VNTTTVQTAARLLNMQRELAAQERMAHLIDLLRTAKAAVTDNQKVTALRALDSLLTMLGQRP